MAGSTEGAKKTILKVYKSYNDDIERRPIYQSVQYFSGVRSCFKFYHS